MAGVIQFTLERDGQNQPWGFRLQGGHDVGLPLTIQRVLCGTPAEGVLRKGDIVCKVSYTDAKSLSHQQAADLFTNAGNQIIVYIKRPGAGGVPLVNNASPGSYQVPNSPSVTSPGGLSAQEKLLQQNLPKNSFTSSTNQAASATPNSPMSLTIQDQPYRTSPLIQPSAKPHVGEIGPGSSWHLKMQKDYISGVKDAQPSPDSQHAKATEFVLKQKVTGSLQQIQNHSGEIPADQLLNPIEEMMQSSQPKSKQFYNNPIGLYSRENVKEVVKLNAMGMSGEVIGSRVPQTDPSSATGTIHPVNKPTKNFLGKGGLPMKYDPEQSATWQAIHEQEDCKLITEHGPQSSKVYSV